MAELIHAERFELVDTGFTFLKRPLGDCVGCGRETSFRLLNGEEKIFACIPCLREARK